jgi:hypothetical protein
MISSTVLTTLPSNNQSMLYFPGKLIVIMNEFFNKQKQIKNEGNTIIKWQKFVERFFSTKCEYCIVMNRDSKDWKFSNDYIYYFLL